MYFPARLERKLWEQFTSISSSEKTWADCLVYAKIFHPYNTWTWYLISQDPNDEDYLWGIVDGHEVEVGSFSLKQFSERIKRLHYEIDLYFEPINAGELFSNLLNERKNDRR